jgi:hypothetical protein
MIQIENSILPLYSQSGVYVARLFEARNHHANASVMTSTGTTTISITPSDS